MRRNEVIAAERLVIKNFFSITFFDWEIKEFNILTGGIAAGKSLCVKLAYFFESVLTEVISSAYKEFFTEEFFYDGIAKEFNDIFHSQDPEHDYHDTYIKYTFETNKREFDLSVKWDAKIKKLKWESKYIDNHIEIWYDKIKSKKNFFEGRGMIMKSISAEFRSHLPKTTLFFPATRAIASIINIDIDTSIKTDIKLKDIVQDKFFCTFIEYTKYIRNLDVFDKSLSEINDILKPYKLSRSREELTIPQLLKFSNEVKLISELVYKTTGKNERVITPLEMSSGQQEIYYLLNLINHLDNFFYFYYTRRINYPIKNSLSLFIEEPSTHLYPQEQKTTIEFIIKNFRKLKDDNKINTRFFVTTHSPYTLNVLNNALLKGKIIEDKEKIIKVNKKKNKKNPKLLNEIDSNINKIKFPHIFYDETTAFFIEDQDKCDNQKKQCRDMMIKDKGVMSADEIVDISFMINDDTNHLLCLINELSGIKEER